MPELDDPGRLDQPVLVGPPERRGVGVPVAELGVVGVGVGVDVDHGQRAVVAGHRAEDRIGDAVVAPHRDRPAAGPVDGVELVGDVAVGLLDVEGSRADVPVVGDADLLVDRQVVDRVVDAHLARVVPDGARRQAGADAVAGARVERHPHERHVEAPGVGDVGQPHEGGDPRVAGIDHAVDGLGIRHGLWLLGRRFVGGRQS